MYFVIWISSKGYPKFSSEQIKTPHQGSFITGFLGTPKLSWNKFLLNENMNGDLTQIVLTWPHYNLMYCTRIFFVIGYQLCTTSCSSRILLVKVYKLFIWHSLLILVVTFNPAIHSLFFKNKLILYISKHPCVSWTN